MIADWLVTEWAPTDLPYEPDPAWDDISTKVRSHRITVGGRGLNDLYAPGQLVLEVNNELDDAPWLDRNTWYRWRQIKVRVSADADVDLFVGWVTSVEHDVGFRDGVAQARITAVDAVGVAMEASTNADFGTYIDDSPIGEWFARTIDNREGYVTDGGAADVARWILGSLPVSMFDNAPFASRMPVFVETLQAGNALQLLQNYLEAERGRLITSGVSVQMFGRYADFDLAAQTPLLTFADDGTGYTWLLGTLELGAPDESYIDEATIGGPGIENQHTIDAPAGYPPSSITRTTQSPIADVNWAKANADMIVQLGKQTETYPRALTAHVASAVASTVDVGHPAIDSAVGYAALDVVFQGTTYKVTPCFKEHQIDASRDGWRCTFGFRSLDRINAAYGDGVFVLGTSALSGTEMLGP